MIKKDQHKRYSSYALHKSNGVNKIKPIMEENINLLGLFFSECLETYSLKSKFI